MRLSTDLLDQPADRISVVIPSFNEAKTIPHVFARLPAGLHEVILVGCYSVDGTAEVARGARITELGSTEHLRIHGISNEHALSDAIRVLRLVLTERWLHRPDGKAIAHTATRRGAKISERLPRQVIGIALKMAGRQRAYLREAWDSDLLNEDGVPLPLPSRLRHVAGYAPAAIRYRIGDLGAVVGHLLDAVLISRRRTYAAAGALFAIPVGMISAEQGLYGLITNAEQLGVLFGVLCASVRGLRKWRDVRSAEAKKGQAAGGGDA